MIIPVEFTEDEVAILFKFLDAGCRGAGLEAARMAVPIEAKLRLAVAMAKDTSKPAPPNNSEVDATSPRA
jgi:hypothetical protein